MSFSLKNARFVEERRNSLFCEISFFHFLKMDLKFLIVMFVF